MQSLKEQPARGGAVGPHCPFSDTAIAKASTTTAADAAEAAVVNWRPMACHSISDTAKAKAATAAIEAAEAAVVNYRQMVYHLIGASISPSTRIRTRNVTTHNAIGIGVVAKRLLKTPRAGNKIPWA